MAGSSESQYKDLLTPLKDAEKAFAVDITELLINYMTELLEKETIPNFNSAALVLQGSASVYAKKVELLYNQVVQLHNNLLKEQKNETEQPHQEKKDSHKERAKKEDEFDLFSEPEIKMGKNLSCLTKKNSKLAKKAAKKVNNFSAPVHLLMMNNDDDKGLPFYDTKGDLIGNSGDFLMNRCICTESGWLLLPTVNPALVPPLDAVSNFYEDDSSLAPIESQESDLEPSQSIPDEGFGSCPSSGLQQCAPEVDSQVANSDQTTPMSTDEGIGETPDAPDFADSPGAKNMPTSNEEGSPEFIVPQPVRQRNRQASGSSCKLSIEESPLLGIKVSKDLCKKKAIAKKNVRSLPEKLRNDGAESKKTDDESISAYCNRIFFSVDDKILRGSLLNFEVESFSQNSSFMKRVTDKLKVLRSSDKRDKFIAPIEDSYLLDIEEEEVSRDANEDDQSLYVPFDDNDVHVEHDPAAMIEQPRMNLPAANDVNLPEIDSPDVSQECNSDSAKNVGTENSDTSETYQQWEKDVKAFLNKMEQRGSFDIDACGSKILNSFEDSKREEQKKTFRELCRSMEKWEIHRSFMALLPLANMGNVKLDKEKKEDGSEEISVTLLSRKMHHKDLEEFNHNDEDNDGDHNDGD